MTRARCKGKTYRKALHTAVAVSEGKHVIYVSNTIEHADVAMRYVCAMLELIGPGVVVIKGRWHVCVTLPNGGSARFIRENQEEHLKRNGTFQGLRPLVFEYDLS